jgi:cupin 2 domain-containing protein
VNPVRDLFADIGESLRNELVETILQTYGFRIERIVSRGHSSPEDFWYDQEEHEWVILLKGSAVLRFEDQYESITMNPGNYIKIGKHQKHRVEWTDPEQDTIWLAVYYS